jgi:hypothetical protein
MATKFKKPYFPALPVSKSDRMHLKPLYSLLYLPRPYVISIFSDFDELYQFMFPLRTPPADHLKSYSWFKSSLTKYQGICFSSAEGSPPVYLVQSLLCGRLASYEGFPCINDLAFLS